MAQQVGSDLLQLPDPKPIRQYNPSAFGFQIDGDGHAYQRTGLDGRPHFYNPLGCALRIGRDA